MINNIIHYYIMSNEIIHIDYLKGRNICNNYKIHMVESKIKIKEETTKKISSGSYGKVYETVDNKILKIFLARGYNISFDIMTNTSILNEINLMSLLNTNVPKILSLYIGNECGYKMNKFNSSLFGYHIKTKSFNKDLQIIIANITYTLAIAQNMNILHRDIKSGNILINESNDIVVADWGLSKYISSTNVKSSKDLIQTIFYRCPEHLLEDRKNFNNDTIDMWSLGILILEQLYGGLYELFKEFTHEEKQFPLFIMQFLLNLLGEPDEYMMHKIKSKNFYDTSQLFKIKVNECYVKSSVMTRELFLKNIKEKFSIGDNLVDFIDKCLKWNPADRLTPQQALKHPYIQELNSKNKQINNKLHTFGLNHKYPIFEVQNIKYKCINVPSYVTNIDNIKRYNNFYFEQRSEIMKCYKQFEHYYHDQYVVALMISYTDYIMSLASVTYLYDLYYIIISIINIVTLIYDDILISDSTIRICMSQLNKKSYLMDKKIINNCMFYLIELLNFPMALKTLFHYNLCFDRTNNIHLMLITEFKILSLKMMYDEYYMGISDYELFGLIIHNFKNLIFIDDKNNEISVSSVIEDLLNDFPLNPKLVFKYEIVTNILSDTNIIFK